MRSLAPLLLAAALFPATAHACRIPSAMTPLLHERLPRPLPAGTVAAEVEIAADVRTSLTQPIDARIIRMLRGHYRGTRLRIDRTVVTSCDADPSPGSRGIVVGRILSRTDALLVIDPIRAPSAREQQLQREQRR
jgi:hypothetical protein